MLSLPDLPDEILHHILSLFTHPNPLEFQSFWSRGITSSTLLPLNVHNKQHEELDREQVQAAKQLCLVSKRLRNVFVPLIWRRFRCSNAVGLKNLGNVCDARGELGGYIQHLDFKLNYNESTPSSCLVPKQLEAIWPRLTKLYSLTLVLTSSHPCPAWLVTQLEQVPTLQTLRLCIFGNSLGQHLKALPQLHNLYIEIHPPDIAGNLSEWIAPDEPVQIQRAFYHDWTELFNGVVDFIEANTSRGNLKQMTWFIYWTMVHSFYKHIEQRIAEPNVKHISPSALQKLSRLSLTLESQMGSQPFLDAAQGLPLTDLAFASYDFRLLNGTVFRVFCDAFPQLRRLRIKLRSPSHTVGDGTVSVLEGSINEEEFVKGLASLRHLVAYKGPVLFQRRTSVEAHRSLKSQVNESLARLVRLLRARSVNPEALFQWHVWTGGVYGPKEYMVLPGEGPEILGMNVE